MCKAYLSEELYLNFDQDSLPRADSMATAMGLTELWYVNSFLNPWIKLRKSFKEAGYRQQEREITCSIKRSETLLYWQGGGTGRIKGRALTMFFLI